MRAHGLPIEVFETANREEAADRRRHLPNGHEDPRPGREIRADGYKILVVGDPNHPEVKGTLSHVPGAWCIQGPGDVDALPRGEPKWASSCSRRGRVTGFTEIVQKLASKYYEVRAVNTICTDTHNRQFEAADSPRKSK